MEIYLKEDRVTTIQRGGANGVTVHITENLDGRAPHWTISYHPASRYGPPAFVEDSHTADIPEELEDVLIWAKQRWKQHSEAQRAA